MICKVAVAAPLALAMVLAMPAHARTSKQITSTECFRDEDRAGSRMNCSSGEAQQARVAEAPRKKGKAPARPRQTAVATAEGVIGGRPPECHIIRKGRLIPFCGCALSVKLYGYVKPALMLADNWRKSFPRTLPAPGMVAARPGHAFQLVSHVSGNIWLVWDANSGGGKIRLHHRSIAGYSIVNPHA